MRLASIIRLPSCEQRRKLSQVADRCSQKSLRVTWHVVSISTLDAVAASIPSTRKILKRTLGPSEATSLKKIRSSPQRCHSNGKTSSRSKLSCSHPLTKISLSTDNNPTESSRCYLKPFKEGAPIYMRRDRSNICRTVRMIIRTLTHRIMALKSAQLESICSPIRI